jgi:Taurine catabolism dioxygenase TauD, TfdA family
MNKTQQETNLSASDIRKQLDLNGFAVADVGNRDNYLTICNQLGKVTQTREIFLKAKELVEKYTGYSHLPDEVPFHTDYPFINVVGLFCEQSDDTGGENLLVDSREILKELTLTEKEALKVIKIPIPRSGDSLPILIEDEGNPPHIYWLPAITLASLDKFD